MYNVFLKSTYIAVNGLSTPLSGMQTGSGNISFGADVSTLTAKYAAWSIRSVARSVY